VTGRRGAQGPLPPLSQRPIEPAPSLKSRTVPASLPPSKRKSEYLRVYYLANREELKQKQRERYRRYRELPEFKAKKIERDRAYVAANRDQHAAYRKSHYAKNRERIKAQNRAWYQANIERRRRQIKDYAIAHRAEAKARSDEWYRNNRARKYAKYRAWVAANPQAFRALWQKRYARQKLAPGAFTAADIERLHEEQKGRCFYCGDCILKGFEVDHNIPLSRGGTNAPSNIVLACRHCNRAKGNKLPDEFVRRTRGTTEWRIEASEIGI
jgi:5-methylcytosine-specific restriction endonuclease McrA